MDQDIASQEPGFQADLSVDARPGVPRTLDDRSTDEVPRTGEGIAQQPPTVRFYKHAERETLTPVFGTAAPPHGLSGVLRARAYDIPEHKAAHFMLLLLADRVDVLEHSVLSKLPFMAAFAVGAGLIAKKVKRPPSRLRRVLH